MEPQQDITKRRRVTTAVIVGVVIIALLAGWLIYHGSQVKRQGSLLARQQAEFAKTATADPILKHLPYGSLDYNITPTFKDIGSNRTLVIDISIILDDSDYKHSQNDISAIVSQKEQEALKYIRSIGFDPSKYHIEYRVPSY